MITLRPGRERGHAQIDWLDSYHTFSFAEYQDPRHMGFRTLRVINEDFIEPGQGFAPHPHKDMEIVTYILEGELAHKDSMGNGSVIRPGDVQRMSAGTGVVHSEFNASDKAKVHLLQIWIHPEKKGIEPGYEQKNFTKSDKANRLRLVATNAPDKDGAVRIHQDAQIYATSLAKGKSVEHPMKTGRHAWVQAARGAVRINGQKMSAGDGAAVTGEDKLQLEALEDSEILLFDLA